MSAIYKATISALDKVVPARMQPLWQHPAGPKTVFFWAPAFKWGLVIAGIGDLQRPVEQLSVAQSASLAATGVIWSRYSLVIIPKNYSLFSVNIFVAVTQIYQLYRAIRLPIIWRRAVLIELLLVLVTYFQSVYMEINVLRISGRNSELDDGKTVEIPIEVYQNQKGTQPEVTILRPAAKAEELLHNLASGNPILATLLLSYSLHISPDSPGFNHPQHLPLNPYVALLLSHYGRYVPLPFGHGSGSARGIYGYTAANNYHNNLPFGSYKIYTDTDA